MFAGGDGLGPYRRLAAASRERLRGDGLLVQLRGRVLTAARDGLGALDAVLAAPASVALGGAAA